MSKPYDATPKALVEMNPWPWLAEVAHLIPDGPLEVQDSDLSTVTASVDRVVIVRGRRPWLVPFEFLSGPEPRLLPRLARDHGLLYNRYELPVESVVIVLHRRANRRDLTGLLEVKRPRSRRPLRIEYTVVRVWERPAADYLASGLSAAPLSVLARDVTKAQLPRIAEQLGDRFAAEAPPDRAQELWSASGVLMGLRFDRTLVRQILREVRSMKESVVYQDIFAEGRAEGHAAGVLEGKVQGKVEGIRDTLLRVGGRLIGPPPKEIVAALNAIDDRDRLNRMVDRIGTTPDWPDILKVK
jgi:hypothetical protein